MIARAQDPTYTIKFNNESVSQAEVHSGDQLQLASYKIEFLDAPQHHSEEGKHESTDLIEVPKKDHEPEVTANILSSAASAAKDVDTPDADGRTVVYTGENLEPSISLVEQPPVSPVLSETESPMTKKMPDPNVVLTETTQTASLIIDRPDESSPPSAAPTLQSVGSSGPLATQESFPPATDEIPPEALDYAETAEASMDADLPVGRRFLNVRTLAAVVLFATAGYMFYTEYVVTGKSPMVNEMISKLPEGIRSVLQPRARALTSKPTQHQNTEPAQPAPVQEVAQPAPAQAAAQPAPAQAAAQPAPAQVAAQPAPAQVAAQPAPAQVAAQPAPARTPVDPFALQDVMHAAQRHKIQAVKDWVENKNFDVNTTDPVGTTILMKAAGAGDASIIQYLLSKGANINAQDSYGTTALMYAASNGHAGAVHLLTNQKADTKLTRNDGDTALTIARRNAYWDLASWLADPSEKNKTTKSRSNSRTAATKKSTNRKPAVSRYPGTRRKLERYSTIEKSSKTRTPASTARKTTSSTRAASSSQKKAGH